MINIIRTSTLIIFVYNDNYNLKTHHIVQQTLQSPVILLLYRLITWFYIEYHYNNRILNMKPQNLYQWFIFKYTKYCIN